MIGAFTWSEQTPTTAQGAGPSVNPVTGGPPDSAAGVAYPLADYSEVELCFDTVGATGGSTDIYVQSSVDGVTWFDCIHLPTIASGAAAAHYRTSLSRYATPATAPVVVGKNTAPALAANTSILSGFGDRLRLFLSPNATVTVGAALTVTLVGYRAEGRKI
jgi:hypothetical protein